ncbi:MULTISPECIES: hypothetical protein [Vagococcus]|uniref:hypothetical protein n=1 Tax=Vagococcus TaxID=2737 RepID=UPI002FC69661
MKKIILSTIILGALGIAGVTTVTLANSTDKDTVNLEQMAKDENMSLDELTEKLTKEGRLTDGLPLTETMTEATASEDVVDLEKMAKEENMTVDELIKKLTEEGKLVEAGTTSPASEVSK